MTGLKDRVMQKLASLGAQPKRSLGQNFLVGETVIERILSAVVQLKPKSLIEVGPGLGALTESLLQMNLPIELLEYDRSFCEIWREKGAAVTECDALRFDWNKLSHLDQCCLVSNLPYQISSSLVIDRSIGPINIENMVLMFQKEVAQKIMAKISAKDYGFLTVVAQSFWRIENLLEAGPNEFFPSPNVASRVLVFRRKKEIQWTVEQGLSYVKFVKAAFQQRRKFLAKNLSTLSGTMALDVNGWKQLLAQLGVSPQARAEELSAEQFIRLHEMALGQ